jgi:hypothetical protein
MAHVHDFADLIAANRAALERNKQIIIMRP